MKFCMCLSLESADGSQSGAPTQETGKGHNLLDRIFWSLTSHINAIGTILKIVHPSNGSQYDVTHYVCVWKINLHYVKKATS